MKALDLGAMGYIPKSARTEVMLRASSAGVCGEHIYSSGDSGARALVTLCTKAIGRLAEVSPTDLGLTDRQLEVLALIVQGKNNKSICQMLKLAEPTVKNHVTAIFKALKVANRAEAVIAVNELGWRLPATPKL